MNQNKRERKYRGKDKQPRRPREITEEHREKISKGVSEYYKNKEELE